MSKLVTFTSLNNDDKVCVHCDSILSIEKMDDSESLVHTENVTIRAKGSFDECVKKWSDAINQPASPYINDFGATYRG